eukprot:scaffold2251_cov178-Amphora_coffeaeformis.AAC.6
MKLPDSSEQETPKIARRTVRSRHLYALQDDESDLKAKVNNGFHGEFNSLTFVARIAFSGKDLVSCTVPPAIVFCSDTVPEHCQQTHRTVKLSNGSKSHEVVIEFVSVDTATMKKESGAREGIVSLPVIGWLASRSIALRAVDLIDSVTKINKLIIISGNDEGSFVNIVSSIVVVVVLVVMKEIVLLVVSSPEPWFVRVLYNDIAAPPQHQHSTAGAKRIIIPNKSPGLLFDSLLSRDSSVDLDSKEFTAENAGRRLLPVLAVAPGRGEIKCFRGLFKGSFRFGC